MVELNSKEDIMDKRYDRRTLYLPIPHPRLIMTGYSKKIVLKNVIIKPISKFPYKKASLLKLRYQNYQEIWLGNHNFQAITAYNHSTNYAMAIHRFAQSLRESPF